MKVNLLSHTALHAVTGLVKVDINQIETKLQQIFPSFNSFHTHQGAYFEVEEPPAEFRSDILEILLNIFLLWNSDKLRIICN